MPVKHDGNTNWLTTTTEHCWGEKVWQNVFRDKTKSVLVRKQVCLSDRRDAEAHPYKQVETSRKGKTATLPGGSGAAAVVYSLQAALVSCCDYNI